MTPGWLKIQERARDVYWLRRRNGGTENEALAAVLDYCYQDSADDLQRDAAEDNSKWSRPSEWANAK